jgi:hypothetical protein
LTCKSSLADDEFKAIENAEVVARLVHRRAIT